MVRLSSRQLKLLHDVICMAPVATRRSSVGIDNQVTLHIVATCVPNGSHKTLCIVIDRLQGLLGIIRIIVLLIFVECRITPATIGVEHLIITLEQQMLVIVLESLGYLFPDRLELRPVLCVVGFVGLDPRLKRTFIGTCIVVHIDDAVQSFVDDIVHHLFHTVHPSLVDLALRVNLLIPCHWHTDSTEASLLHHLDKFGFRHGLSPANLMFFGRFPRFSSIVGIEGITQIPTHSHVLYSFLSRFNFCCLSMERSHQKHTGN